LPPLSEFVERVAAGGSDTILGAYAAGHFALRVVQQPTDNAAYISEAPDTLTEFGPARETETVVLLAHNFLGGQHFAEMNSGASIALVYADGSLQYLTVTHARRFQALKPESPYSDFIDLDTRQLLTSSELAGEMYTQPGAVVLQTCIEAEGNREWGRLFVIARADSVPDRVGY